MDLKDRVALVAGGTGTLGIAIARALAKEGAHVAITYLERKDAAKETCAAVEGLGRRAWSIALDQTDAAAIAARHRGGGAPVRPPRCAGQQRGVEHQHPVPGSGRARRADLGPAVLDEPARPLPAVPRRRSAPEGERLRPHRQHRLGRRAQSGGSSIAYATSKAGLIHLTRCLAVALAPEVSVNCVAPGLMEGTRMTSRLRPELADGARQRAVLRARRAWRTSRIRWSRSAGRTA